MDRRELLAKIGMAAAGATVALPVSAQAEKQEALSSVELVKQLDAHTLAMVFPGLLWASPSDKVIDLYAALDKRAARAGERSIEEAVWDTATCVEVRAAYNHPSCYPAGSHYYYRRLEYVLRHGVPQTKAERRAVKAALRD